MIPRTLTAPDDCKVFTPAPLADAMARILPNRPGDRWLEPCVGKGVFLDALGRCGVAPGQITAVELDRHDGLLSRCGRYHPGVDFLGWSLRTGAKYDRIIGNPPYLPLHRVPWEVREAALRIPRPGGGFVPPKANCWYAFLCASLRLLKPGGGLCFVLPSGWEYADYAADVRDRLPEMFARFEVIRSETSFFAGVLDGCVVVVADGFGDPVKVRRRSDHSSLQEVIEYLATPCKPWHETPHASSKEHGREVFRSPEALKFGDIARVRIGTVTGDVAYFLLNEAQRIEHGLPLTSVRPVLTRARQLTGSSVSRRDWESLLDSGERVWLFWPPVRRGPMPKSVTAYLRQGEAKGLPLREKVRVRSPWYRTRIPPPADGFLSGMTPFGPWISLNRMDGLIVTNTLYTVHFIGRLKLCEKAAWSLSLMCSSAAAQHAELGRRYSDGLFKFEPKDVMSLRIPRPVDMGPGAVRVYRRVVEELVRRQIDRARSIAETFVTGGVGSA